MSNGSMGNTFKKLTEITAAQAKKAKDFESLLFAGERKYKNSMVEVTHAEVFSLRHTMKEMYEEQAEQRKLIIELMQLNIELGNKVTNLEMKLLRQGHIHVERTVTETVDITVAPSEDEVIGVRSNRMNIDWSISPVDTAFGLFDKYCHDNHHTSAITAEIVRQNWSTLYTTCKQKTGMTLGRLLKQYAKERELNY